MGTAYVAAADEQTSCNLLIPSEAFSSIVTLPCPNVNTDGMVAAMHLVWEKASHDNSAGNPHCANLILCGGAWRVGRAKVNCRKMQTCRMLSSATEATTQSSVGFHAKSDTFEVCPPWMNSNSGGPSSASSGDCVRQNGLSETFRVPSWHIYHGHTQGLAPCPLALMMQSWLFWHRCK